MLFSFVFLFCLKILNKFNIKHILLTNKKIKKMKLLIIRPLPNKQCPLPKKATPPSKISNGSRGAKESIKESIKEKYFIGKWRIGRSAL
tara:strand:+ start:13491 stop:13757 length:267 start_codon:yes stop_codon:yes gene_type:complete